LKSPLEPEELAAILAAVAPKGVPRDAQVALRDFARPQRLSSEQRGALRERLVRALPALENDLAGVLRSRVKVNLSDVDESEAQLAITQLRPPMSVAKFRVGSEPCWVVWDNAASVAALELALGAPEAKEMQPRMLSSVEGMLFKRLVACLLKELGGVLRFAPEDLRVVRLLEDLGSPRDAGERFDPRRLLLLVELELPTGNSTLRLYLPAPKSDDPTAHAPALKAQQKLPEHLGAVSLSISARLGVADFGLADLLALEVGDVIPLGVHKSQPLEVWAEDRPWAHALLGSCSGQLALRLHSPRAKDDQ
jgi:flagellar motor switch protein FliM